MHTKSLKLERRFLIISSIGNVIVATVGLLAALYSSSQAILLDGLFNLTYFATGLFTLRVATLVAGGDDDRFPHGYAFFESLVNGIKGMLVLGVSVMAMIGALQALAQGGRSIAAGMAIAYGVFATIVCCVISYFMYRGTKTTGSPLVAADAKNWIVNAAISACVLLAFASILLLQALNLGAVVPYVDPSVVLIVVLISIGVPVKMAWNALMELLNRAPTSDIVNQVTRIVDENLASLPVQERFVRVIQPGRHRLVMVHAVLPTDYHVDSLKELDAVRAKTCSELCKSHVATVLDITFTSDRKWGAPMSDGGQIGD